MADTAAASAGHHGSGDGTTKRDFLKLVAGAGAAIGAGAIAWPLIDSMNPAKDVLALSSIDVDLTPVVAGQAITAVWRGKPIFIRHRTAKEIEEAAKTPLNQLNDPQSDADRVKKGHEKWLVVVGICTHLGCIPLGEQGEFGGWFCPCHGSDYDTSGRIRKGPAPANLAVPEYTFLNDTRVRIG